MAIGRFSDYQVNAWLDDLSEVWFALHFANPDTDGAYASEVFGGAYVRQRVTMSMPTGRVIWNNNVAAFTGLPATMLTHLGVWDAVINGNFLIGLPILDSSDPRAGIRVLAGGRYDIGIEQVALSFP